MTNTQTERWGFLVATHAGRTHAAGETGPVLCGARNVVQTVAHLPVSDLKTHKGMCQKCQAAL